MTRASCTASCPGACCTSALTALDRDALQHRWHLCVLAGVPSAPGHWHAAEHPCRLVWRVSRARTMPDLCAETCCTSVRAGGTISCGPAEDQRGGQRQLCRKPKTAVQLQTSHAYKAGLYARSCTHKRAKPWQSASEQAPFAAFKTDLTMRTIVLCVCCSCVEQRSKVFSQETKLAVLLQRSLRTTRGRFHWRTGACTVRRQNAGGACIGTLRTNACLKCVSW